jgi:hypothetical protein
MLYMWGTVGIAAGILETAIVATASTLPACPKTDEDACTYAAEFMIKELGEDFRPDPTFIFGIRFSISPDGQSFVYSKGRYRSDLWMFEGYGQPGWADRLLTAFRKQP